MATTDTVLATSSTTFKAGSRLNLAAPTAGSSTKPTTASDQLALSNTAQSSPWLMSHGNKVTPLIDATQVLPAILDAIKNAHDSIEVQSFLFGGKFAQQIAEALVQKKKEGVDVRVMVDPKLNIVGEDDHQAALDYLKANGVEVRTYPTQDITPQGSWLTHYRAIAHRKMVLVDGKTAIDGGMNLSEGGAQAHDFMVKEQGPVASQLNGLFNRDWATAGGKLYPTPPAAPEMGNSEVAIAETSPTTKNIPSLVLSQFASARKSIQIEALYLTDPDYLQAVIDAHRRGVDVQVILDDTAVTRRLPLSNVADSIGIGTFLDRKTVDALHAEGIPVHVFTPHDGMSYLHGKMAIIDGAETLIGSANFTTQAAKSNSELMTAVEDPTTAQAFARQFQTDWTKYSKSV